MASCIETVGGEITEHGYKVLFSSLAGSALEIPIYRRNIIPAAEARMSGKSRKHINLLWGGDVMEHLMFDAPCVQVQAYLVALQRPDLAEKFTPEILKVSF